jgi:DNA-binding transcriptional ArsR family regulator
MASDAHGREDGVEPIEGACADEHHAGIDASRISDRLVERAARMFRALGDEARLRTLSLLLDREACESEIAAATEEQMSTVSHRLRLLRSEGFVARRRSGRHILYSVADDHVALLVRQALAHADHLDDHRGDG